MSSSSSRAARTLPAACVLLLLLLAGDLARAKELAHVLRAGETLQSLARHYYGATWKSSYIQGRNGLWEDTVPVGAKVVIPATWTYTVRRGDTLAKLAKRYVGRLERHRVLAEMNRLREGQQLAVGQELVMPFHIRYTLKKGESLSTVARRFYRTTRRASSLKDYNGGQEPGPGTTITVPIFDRAALAPHKKGPPPLTASPASQAEGSNFDPAAVQAAVAAYHAGNFSEAQQALEEQLELGPPKASLPLMLQYLGFCAVAHDQPGDAEEYFRQWLQLQPSATLDPVRTSPKILEQFNRARQTETSLLSPSPGQAGTGDAVAAEPTSR